MEHLALSFPPPPSMLKGCTPISDGRAPASSGVRVRLSPWWPWRSRGVVSPCRKPGVRAERRRLADVWRRYSSALVTRPPSASCFSASRFLLAEPWLSALSPDLIDDRSRAHHPGHTRRPRLCAGV